MTFVAIAVARYKDLDTRIEYITPTNRFYGSTMFAPKGIGMSQKGYTSDQVSLRSVWRFRALEFPYMRKRKANLFSLC
jgi:hypothetical protein